jgi:pimeloyl-ACP methyl ester carboxylesterase
MAAEGEDRLEWGTEGAGASVLLVHGLGASSHAFLPLIQEAKARFRFHWFDLPSAGRSGDFAPAEPFALAERVAKELTTRAAAPAWVVGHSFGGLVALALAARHPAQVRGLVLASVPAFGLGRIESLFKLKAVDWVAELGRALPKPRAAVELYLRAAWGSEKPLTADHVDAYLGAMDPKEYFPTLIRATRAMAQFRFPAELGASGLPMRVLWGLEDRVVPPRMGERLAEALGAPLELLPGTGHCVPEERPDALLLALEALSREQGEGKGVSAKHP